jgi:hypothetical protein
MGRFDSFVDFILPIVDWEKIKTNNNQQTVINN